MSESKKLKESGKKKGGFYGTLGDEMKVVVDEKAGLLEAKYVSEDEITGVYQASPRSSYSYTSTGMSGSGGSGSGSGSGSSQYTSRSASRRSSVISGKSTIKKGGYELWKDRSRSRSYSDSSSGSSDEIYSRDSGSSTSTHCHDITSDQPEDRLAMVKLILATLLSLIFMGVIYAGGYYSSSLAVLSDAGHLLSDFTGFLVSLVALCLVRRPPSTTMNFGYYRAEVVGSVCSVLVVWVVTGLLVTAAVQRILYQPYDLDPDIMLIMASVGVFINIIIALMLHGCGCQGYYHGARKNTRKTFTMRAALVHAIADTLQTLSVLAAAVVVKIWPEYKMADPILTIVFGVIVIATTFPILRDLAHILMEGSPKNIDFLSLLSDLEGLPGVRTVHNLHVWSLTMDKNALAVHLVIDPSFDPETVLEEAHRVLRRDYPVSTATIQIERYAREMETCRKCQTPVSG